MSWLTVNSYLRHCKSLISMKLVFLQDHDAHAIMYDLTLRNRQPDLPQNLRYISVSPLDRIDSVKYILHLIKKANPALKTLALGLDVVELFSDPVQDLDDPNLPDLKLFVVQTNITLPQRVTRCDNVEVSGGEGERWRGGENWQDASGNDGWGDNGGWDDYISDEDPFRWKDVCYLEVSAIWRCLLSGGVCYLEVSTRGVYSRCLPSRGVLGSASNRVQPPVFLNWHVHSEWKSILVMLGAISNLLGSPTNNASSVDIRQSILEWTVQNAPRHDYIRIKGVAQERKKGYVWICTIFSGAIPPTPELGDPSDIYIDTRAKKIHVKLKPKIWQSWVPGTHINHPLGAKCQVSPNINQGIRWQTYNAIKSHRAKFPAVRSMDVEAIIRQTYVYHPYLDPNNPEGVGKVGLCKEVRGKRKASSVSSSPPSSRENSPARKDPTPAPPSPPAPLPRDPTPQPTGNNHELDFDFNMEDPDGVFNDDIDIPFADDDLPRPRGVRRKNKRPRVSSFSSHRTTPPLSPKQSFLSKFVAATIPLFRKLLDKPKIWLNLLGIQFPEDAPTIQWANGIWTVLPWQQCDESLEENPDVIAVKHMSQAPDVTDPDQIRSSPGDARVDRFEKDPAVVVMEWTPDLRGPQPSSSDDDLLGYNSEAVVKHVAKYSEWLNQLQRHLAAARYVIVRNWIPNARTNWDVGSIGKFKGCMDQVVQVQDAGLRAAQYHLTPRQQEECGGFHRTLPLREFVKEGINKPSICGNCLDSPGLRAEVPPFIVDIADCTRAYELTRSDNAIKLPLCVSNEATTQLPAWIKKRKKAPQKDTRDRCGKCVDVQKMNEWMEQARMKEKDQDWDYYESAEPKKSARPRHKIPEPEELPPKEPVIEDKSKKPISWLGHIFQPFSKWGPFSISWDTWKASIWDLVTHAGFFTYVHHDGAGFCTYAFVRDGCKIWGIHRPKVTEKDDTRHSIFDIKRKILRPHGWTSYIEYSDLYNVFLMPGDVLIQPPNAIHQVYTPVNCLASGGHFFNWFTLHLTELSKAFDRFYCHTATNADHECSFRSHCRMTMSIPLIAKSKTFLRRPVLALAAMILRPNRYEPDPESSEERPRLATDDIHRLEVEADHKTALEIIKRIMFIHNLTEESIREELSSGGVDWEKAGDVEIDLSAVADISHCETPRPIPKCLITHGVCYLKVSAISRCLLIRGVCYLEVSAIVSAIPRCQYTFKTIIALQPRAVPVVTEMCLSCWYDYQSMPPKVSNIDASHSTFNAVGGNQTNETVIDRRVSITINVYPPSASVIVLTATCVCIVIGFKRFMRV
ncbi:hypothetical protein PILCRDRAFT_93306 [Piloderma croceum F 1598]|uniref:JmjC domain-containing protein n=1 Tax=Piloderma croceum (strain F 1598) TaxID=765440 RepID=A0A0C3EJH7_PILCF|nr:hypothetical protein PILCRDRAFT_93306 [Piloderma croceum F 1598]